RASGNSFLHRGLCRALRLLAYRKFNCDLLQTASFFKPHVVLVTKGSDIKPQVLGQIKAYTHAFLVNYATDDPFNPESSTRNVVEAIPLYDLYVTTKRATISDLRLSGAHHVIWIPFGYEPALHFLETTISPEESKRWESDVVFVGGCDQDRILLFRALAKLPNLRLSIYGGYWDRHPALRRFWHGIVLGREYRLA